MLRELLITATWIILAACVSAIVLVDARRDQRAQRGLKE